MATAGMRVEFVAQPVAENVREDEPLLAGIRARWGAIEAVAELAAQGLIVPACGPSTEQEFRNYEGVPERIGFQHPGGVTSVLVPSWAPAVVPCGRRSRLIVAACISRARACWEWCSRPHGTEPPTH